MIRIVRRSIGLLALTLLMGALTPVTESPVADAAQDGDVAKVRSLLRGGADVNAAQGDGMTALHWAAVGADGEMAELLLLAGAHPNPRTRLGSYTPLHLASRQGSVEVVRTLLSNDADVEALTSTGVGPLHLASESGSVEAVEALIDHGADPDVRDLRSGRTPLVFATASGRVEVMKTLLEAGADPSLTTYVVDYAQLSELDRTERQQRARLIAAAQGQDPEQAANTPLGPYGATQAAAERRAAARAASGQAVTEEELERQARLAEEERKAGAEKAEEEAQQEEQAKEEVQEEEDQAKQEVADQTQQAVDPDQPTDPDRPTAAGGNSQGPLSYAQLVGKQGGMSPLHLAARDGRTEAALLLLEAGVDVNVRTGGDEATPLLVAVINGNYDLALELLERGADPNLISEDGAGPLFAAINGRWAHRTWYPQPNAWQQQESDHLVLMEALLEAGADPNQRLTTHLWYVTYNAGRIGVDYSGATPFLACGVFIGCARHASSSARTEPTRTSRR